MLLLLFTSTACIVTEASLSIMGLGLMPLSAFVRFDKSLRGIQSMRKNGGLNPGGIVQVKIASVFKVTLWV